jgi:hypothetical protein
LVLKRHGFWGMKQSKMKFSGNPQCRFKKQTPTLGFHGSI